MLKKCLFADLAQTKWKHNIYYLMHHYHQRLDINCGKSRTRFLHALLPLLARISAKVKLSTTL